MGVIELNEANFYLDGRRNKKMKINLPGVVMVLFKMQDCQGCAQAEPVFRQLSNEIQGIRFAVLNLSYAFSIRNMSSESSTPINVVPFVLLYNNGDPFAKFKGRKSDINSLRRFVSDILSAIKERSAKQPSHQGGIYAHGYQDQNNEGKRYFVPSQERGFSNKRRGHNYAPAYEEELEEGEQLKIPDSIIPHNRPWEGKYKSMDDLDDNY